jgi:hypothetical protein
VPKTVAILRRLGYRIVDVDVWVAEQSASSADSEQTPAAADLLIVDESRFDELRSPQPGTLAARLPIVLLTGRHGIGVEDARIVGAIRRPAGLHDLYRLAQQLFEDTPRTIPRVPTDLLAHCTRGDASWDGRLISLSENGGLVRAAEKLTLGSCFNLRFELPGHGPVELRAEAAYQLVPDLGVVFSGLEPTIREALGEFVAETILAA